MTKGGECPPVGQNKVCLERLWWSWGFVHSVCSLILSKPVKVGTFCHVVPPMQLKWINYSWATTFGGFGGALFWRYLALRSRSDTKLDVIWRYLALFVKKLAISKNCSNIFGRMKRPSPTAAKTRPSPTVGGFEHLPKERKMALVLQQQRSNT